MFYVMQYSFVLLSHLQSRKATLRSGGSSDTGKDGHDQSRLYYAHTASSRLKRRALENVYDLYSDLESVGGEGSLDDFDDDVLDDLEPERRAAADGEVPRGGHGGAGGAPGAGAGGDAGDGEGKDDPTFELANVRRYIIGEEPLSQVVANSRKMFLLKVNKLNEALDLLILCIYWKRVAPPLEDQGAVKHFM